MADVVSSARLNPSCGYNVDLVICLDAGSSMCPVIDTLRKNAHLMFDRIIDGMEEDEKEASQIRVKVIAFRDFGGSEKPIEESRFFTLPDDTDLFCEFLNRIEPSGAPHAPRAALEALSLALGSDFTRGGVFRRHLVLMFSDGEVQPLGCRAECEGYPVGIPQSLDGLRARWEGTDPDFVSAYQRNAGRLITFAPNEEPWSAIDEWNRCWHVYSTVGEGLSGLSFEEIVNLIVGVM